MERTIQTEEAQYRCTVRKIGGGRVAIPYDRAGMGGGGDARMEKNARLSSAMLRFTKLVDCYNNTDSSQYIYTLALL